MDSFFRVLLPHLLHTTKLRRLNVARLSFAKKAIGKQALEGHFFKKGFKRLGYRIFSVRMINAIYDDCTPVLDSEDPPAENPKNYVGKPKRP